MSELTYKSEEFRKKIEFPNVYIRQSKIFGESKVYGCEMYLEPGFAGKFNVILDFGGGLSTIENYFKNVADEFGIENFEYLLSEGREFAKKVNNAGLKVSDATYRSFEAVEKRISSLKSAQIDQKTEETEEVER